MARLTTGLLIAVVCGAALAADEAPPPRAVDVAAIVRQLGSEDYAEREAATRRLSTLSVDDVPPELLAALKSDNPEVRDRAARAARALKEHIAAERERAAAARLPRGERFARLGRIDLYVASTAATDYKANDLRLWVPAYELGVRVVEKAEMTGDRKPQGGATWFKDFSTYCSAYPSLRFTRSTTTFDGPAHGAGGNQNAIQSAGVTTPDTLYALVVSRGSVVAASFSASLILANGDLRSRYDISNSVVICDGDVRLKGDVQKSLVVARGNITVGGTASASTLVAGGTVTIATPPEPARRVANPLLQRELDSYKVVVEEKVAKPLGYITFFELSAVGVEVAEAGGAVRVTKVAGDRPFAAAGARAGDVVAAVSGKKPDGAESLRRLLRDSLALGNATVTLKRGEATVTVTVALPD